MASGRSTQRAIRSVGRPLVAAVAIGSVTFAVVPSAGAASTPPVSTAQIAVSTSEPTSYQPLPASVRAGVETVLAASQTPLPTTVPLVTTTAKPGTAAAVAIAFALAQRGLPYVWGGDGPGAGEAGFDCSGLTTAAYAAAGIALPRTAHTQFYAGPHVPAGAVLEPGDLVFYGVAARVHHVGLYLGNGLMVNAPTFGEPVQIAYVRYAGDDYLGATRPAAGHDTPGLLTTPDLPYRVPPVPEPSAPKGPTDFPAPAAPVPAATTSPAPAAASEHVRAEAPSLASSVPTPPATTPSTATGSATPEAGSPSSTETVLAGPDRSTAGLADPGAPGTTPPGTVQASPAPPGTTPTSPAPPSTARLSTARLSTAQASPVPPGTAPPGTTPAPAGTTSAGPTPPDTAPASPAPPSTTPLGATPPAPSPSPTTQPVTTAAGTTPPVTVSSSPATTPPLTTPPGTTPAGSAPAPATTPAPRRLLLPASGTTLPLVVAARDANGLPVAPTTAARGSLNWRPGTGGAWVAAIALPTGLSAPAVGATVVVVGADGTRTTLTVRSRVTTGPAAARAAVTAVGQGPRVVLVRTDPASGQVLVVVAS